MEERNIRRLVTLVFCIGMTVLGVYMTFFGGKQEKKSNEEGTEELYQEGRLPEVENSSAFEQYGNGAGTDIYFSNTDVIDQGNLPLEVHAKLAEAAGRYLDRSGYEDVTELYVDDGTYVEDEAYTAFECYMDGYTAKLRITYETGDSILKFSIVGQEEGE